MPERRYPGPEFHGYQSDVVDTSEEGYDPAELAEFAAEARGMMEELFAEIRNDGPNNPLRQMGEDLNRAWAQGTRPHTTACALWQVGPDDQIRGSGICDCAPGGGATRNWHPRQARAALWLPSNDPEIDEHVANWGEVVALG